MQYGVCDDVAPPYDQSDACRAVVADLTCLIEHVQTSLRLIEQAIGRETSSGGLESSANVIVLDDVSPRYMKTHAALLACDASLTIALHSLQDADGTDAYAARASCLSIAGA